MGIEPTTYSLGSCRSTTELRPRRSPFVTRAARGFNARPFARGARGVSLSSNEHWSAWRGGAPPRLFSDRLDESASEPIAEVAKAIYNWGPDARLDPFWRALHDAINAEHEKLTAP